MEKEIKPLIRVYTATVKNLLVDMFPFYTLSKAGKHEIFFVETFVGGINAATATILAIKECDPDIVLKVGCVGANSKRIHKGDIILPLGYFYTSSWITKSRFNGRVTSNAKNWQTLFGEKPYQVNENNLGNIPYSFSSEMGIMKSYQQVLKKLNVKYAKAYIGSGDIWIFSKAMIDNINRTLVSESTPWVADMESTAIAHTCHIFNKPFLGFYIVSDSLHYKEEYKPLEVMELLKKNLSPVIVSFIETLHIDGN